MTTVPRAGAEQAAGSETLNRAARGGLVAYGVVHLLIGWLALQLAAGSSKGSTDNQGALHTVADTPVGGPLLWLIALGFLALVVWQLTEAAVGHTDEDGKKRTGKRALSAGKAVVYAAIGWSAVKFATGSGSSGDSGKETFTAHLMSLPAGQWLVGLVGLAIIVGGGAFIWRGWTAGFREHLEGEAGGSIGTAIVTAGRVGYIAKGAAFAILGALFVVAAVKHDPQRSGGLDDALKTLLGEPSGHVLVAVIGIGFACFGGYLFARAKAMRTGA